MVKDRISLSAMEAKKWANIINQPSLRQRLLNLRQYRSGNASDTDAHASSKTNDGGRGGNLWK